MTHRTAHIDRFVLDRLPPPDQQPAFLFDRPEYQYPDRLNAATMLLDDPLDEGFGAKLAIVNDAGAWTYAELSDVSDRIARLLVGEEGLVPGNRVLLRGLNGMTLFAAWFGVLKAGGIAVTAMPLLRAGEIATILARGHVSHAIVDSRCLDDFTAATSIEPVGSLLFYDGDAGTGPLEARLAAVAPGFHAVDTHRDDPALLAFTSGTTGVPKATVQYHRDLLIPADGFCRHIVRADAGDRFCGSAPIGFTFGLGALALFPFRCRATSITVEAPTPSALLDAIERHRVTRLFTAPTAYKAMLDLLPGPDLSSLRGCVSAGEHLPAATSDAWAAATGHPLIDGIGATEMMHIFISAPADAARPGATGRAVPGYEVGVMGPDGEVRPSGTGPLAVRGPTGCRYLDDPRQRDYVVDGWNLTGDTYRVDEEGWCWFVARSDDMIVSAGYNIAAPEVENALYRHPAVAECAVVGVPDAARGHVVKAFVVPAPGTEPGPALARTLQDSVKQAIAPYKYPRLIEFVTALPKTQTGKIRRFELRS